MKRALAAALVAALLAPTTAAAQGAGYDYPPEWLALVPAWIAEAEALALAEDRERPWWPQAQEFLDKAKAAQEAGRLRVAIFDLETFTELVLAHQLMDEAAELGSDAERRTFVLQRTAAWKADAEDAWASFRARLHEYDPQLRSLVTIEKAIYAADVALTAAVVAGEHEALAREFPKQPGFPDGYVLALVRASHTPILVIGYASDMLAQAVKDEGLPPRVVDERWANLTTAALNVSGDAPDYLKPLDDRARPARENGEATLAVAFLLAEQRAARANGMQTIFGDARSRGLDVVNDAARGMNRQLNETSLDAPRSYGLAGVFTSDALDRALLTNEFLAAQKADLGTVIVAWSALEHQAYALSALAAVSPVQPPEPKEAPGVALALALVALAGAALVARRRD